MTRPKTAAERPKVGRQWNYSNLAVGYCISIASACRGNQGLVLLGRTVQTLLVTQNKLDRCTMVQSVGSVPWDMTIFCAENQEASVGF